MHTHEKDVEESGESRWKNEASDDGGSYYVIRSKGHLDDHWADWFEPMTLKNAEDGEAILSGYLPDQSALFGILSKIRDLGLPLLSVIRSRKPPD